MNKIYSKVWSKALGRMVVASEFASSDVVGAVAGGTRASLLRHPLGAALALVLTGASLVVMPAHAGEGIYVNDGSDADCVAMPDDTSGSLAQVSDSARCGTADADTQSDRALFYGDGAGATSLSLGGSLSVNSGRINLGGAGAGDIMLGDATTLATGGNALAIGAAANAGNASAIAMGTAASAAGLSAIGIGEGSNALGASAVAVGAGSIAEGNESIALGYLSNTMGDSATALGGLSFALSTGTTATGYLSSAIGLYSTANGYGATAAGQEDIAIGHNATTDLGWGVAIGGYSYSMGQSVAIGYKTNAVGINTVAIGWSASTAAANATSIGYLTSATGLGSTAVGSFALASHTNASAFGTGAAAMGWQSTAVGYGAKTTNTEAYGVAIGSSSQVSANSGVAIGFLSTAAAEGAIAIGGNSMETGSVVGATAAGFDSIALGAEAAATGRDSMGLGAHSWGRGEYATAVGYNSYGLGDNSATLGANAWAMALNSTALGSNTSATAENSVALGHGSATGDRVNTVSMGAAQDWTDDYGVVHAAIDRQITNVAAGTEATDAVNKGQLDAVAAGVADANDYFAAVGAGDGSDLAVASGANSIALGAGSVADRDNTVSVGTAGAERQITNVAAGTQATDAVNKGQLDAAISTVDGDVGVLDATAVKYDDSATKDAITLGGTAGTSIHNLAAGTADTDAVNYAQLSSVASIFGGGAAFDANGLFGAPVYMVQGGSYGNVGDAFAAFDGALTSLSTRVLGLEQSPGAGMPMGTGDGLAIGEGSHAQDGNDTAFGAGAVVNADGSTAVGNNSFIDAAATNSVAVGADSSVTAASGTAIGQGASVTAAGAVAIGQGSVANAANTVSVGTVGAERRITNVAAGTGATDAVNLSQMQAGDQAAIAAARTYTDTTATQTLTSANAYTDQRLAGLDANFAQLNQDVWARLGEQDQRIDRQGAMSAAMMNMSINAAGSRSPRGRVAVGAGWQNGESALSVGYSKQIGERASFSLGGAFSSDDQSAGVGFGFDL